MYEEIDPADWADEDYREMYHEYHKGDKILKFPCPDCGRENAISKWHKLHGYHCEECRRRRTERGR